MSPVIHFIWRGSVLACGRRWFANRTVASVDPKRTTCQRCKQTRRWVEATGKKHPNHAYLPEELVDKGKSDATGETPLLDAEAVTGLGTYTFVVGQYLGAMREFKLLHDRYRQIQPGVTVEAYEEAAKNILYWFGRMMQEALRYPYSVDLNPNLRPG